MKKSVMALLALALAPALSLGQGTGKPTMEVAEKILDFGVVTKGEVIKADFVIRNTGTAPLEITQVRPTCGCTVAKHDRVIAPGATGTIHAEVETASFSGPNSKAVLVFSNDPDNPQVNLVVKFDARAFVEVYPRPLLSFNVLQGEPATDKVVVATADGSPLRITGADTGGGPFKVAYRELPEKERIPSLKGQQWEVSVTVPADAPQGMLNQKITLKTSNPKAPEVSVSVSGIVRPIIQVVPGEINFGTIQATAPVGRNVVLISNRQDAKLELTSVEVDNKAFTAEVIPLTAGQRYQVAVTLGAGAPKGTHRTTVRIATNDPARPRIEVPVLAVVQ
jgi:hypothetical protein